MSHMSAPRKTIHSHLLIALLFVLKMHAQSFTPGNLALLRIGNGTEVLTNSGNTMFVDQYTPSGVFVNSSAVPDTGTGALLVSGVSGSEGGLTRSLDRSLLVLAGYNLRDRHPTGVERDDGLVRQLKAQADLLLGELALPSAAA